MKIKILGTAASEGIPGVFCTCDTCARSRELGGRNIRTRSQSIINDRFLIDFPPDTYMHVLKQNLRLAEISHLIVTHAHDDHFHPADLHCRRPPFACCPADDPLTVYGPEAVISKYLAAREQWHDDEIDTYIDTCALKPYQAVELEGLIVTPLLALHDRRMECFIYAFEFEGKKLLYGHDTGFFPKATMDYVKNTYFDCVILDCTTGLDRDGDNHMGIEDNLQLQREMLEAGCADEKTVFVMSHFSHSGRLTHNELEKIARHNGFVAAYDGFEMEI